MFGPWLPMFVLTAASTCANAGDITAPNPVGDASRYSASGTVSQVARSPDGRYSLRAEARVVADPAAARGRYMLRKQTAVDATCGTSTPPLLVDSFE